MFDAIWRVYLGRWAGGNVKTLPEKEMNTFHESWRLIRQAAFDGLLPTWGKLGPVGYLFEPIPKEFWKDGNLCWEAFESDDPEGVWAMPNVGAYFGGRLGHGNYSELKTSRARVDELWPAVSSVPSERIESTFAELVQHVAKRFSSPNAIETEIRKRLGELAATGYGYDRAQHSYPSPIPKNFWKVADLKILEFLNNPQSPSEIIVGGDAFDWLFNDEESPYKPQGDECKLYQLITVKADEMRRLWP